MTMASADSSTMDSEQRATEPGETSYESRTVHDADTPKNEKSSESDIEQGEPAKQSAPFDPRQNPDGGTSAYLCMLGGFCTLFCSFGLISMIFPFLCALISRTNNCIDCVGVFQAYYEAVTLRGYSPSTVGWISSLMICFMFLGGPVIGTE